MTVEPFLSVVTGRSVLGGRGDPPARGICRFAVPGRPRGAMLLEVVLSVGILTLAMAVVGTQINMAWDEALSSEELTTAVFLAESKLAELDSGLLTFEREMEGDFDEAFPRFGWRILAESSINIEGMLEVEITIVRGTRFDGEEEYAFDEDSKVLYTLHTLRRENVTTGTIIDLEVDFGLDPDENMSEGGAPEGCDLMTLFPEYPNVNFREVVNLPPEELLVLLECVRQIDPNLFGAGGAGGLGGQAQNLLDEAGQQPGEGQEADGSQADGQQAGGQQADAGQAAGGQAGGQPSGGQTGGQGQGQPNDQLPTLEEFLEMMENRR